MVVDAMSIIIKLMSDIGELRVWLATIVLRRALDEDLLSRIKGMANGCRDSLVTVVPANKILNAWHMIYPAYLSLRDHIMGISKFKDPGLGALTYMAGTTQLREGLNLLHPVGHDKISVIIMGINDCVSDVTSKIMNLLGDKALDVVIGAGVNMVCDCAFTSIDDFIRTLISEYVDEFA
jgi:hypothetical protein